MKHQALFSSKGKSLKKNKVSSASIFVSRLRVSNIVNLLFAIVSVMM